MIIEKQTLDNVLLFKPEVFKDKRCYFFESYRSSVLIDNSINKLPGEKNLKLDFIKVIFNEIFNFWIIRSIQFCCTNIVIDS